MQRTRREALDELLDWVGAAGDTRHRNTAEALLNRTIEEIWQAHTWRDYQSPDPYQVTLVSGTRSYVLPDWWGRLSPNGKVRNLTKGSELYPMTQAQLESLAPEAGTSLETAHVPSHYLLGGVMAVTTQVTSAGQAVEVVSSSTSDTDVVATVEGVDSAGRWVRSQVTLNGTSVIAAGTWTRIDGFGKAFPAGITAPTEYTSSRGTVTLRLASVGATLQTLLPAESAKEHRVVTFYPKPNVTDVIALPFLRRPKRLLNDADMTPGDWWSAIFEGMVNAWRANAGEVLTAAALPTPRLKQLIELENATAMRPPSRPFGGALHAGLREWP